MYPVNWIFILDPVKKGEQKDTHVGESVYKRKTIDIIRQSILT